MNLGPRPRAQGGDLPMRSVEESNNNMFSSCASRQFLLGPRSLAKRAAVACWHSLFRCGQLRT